MTTNLIFRSGLSQVDPHETPVLIIGQVKHLTQLRWKDIKVKLEPRVSEETFKIAVSGLQPSPTDSCSLYLNYATVAALPLKCSRHNTPSRAHSLTRLVQSAFAGTDEYIVIVCERSDVYASACAVARAFPLYSRKSSNNDETVDVSVEFITVPSNGVDPPEDAVLTSDDIKCLEDAVTGIRLAAKIVDTPCNEMNVDNFLEEIRLIGAALNITPLIIRDKELAKKGFGGIYGVGKAAAVPPALAVLSYTPEGATNTIAWVGKGIVYDTGGLSIKGKTAMPGMKRDCGGAAGVLGAFYAVVKANFTQNLHAVFCLAENAVGPNATRPDDIHTLYSGRTVEINNTDAEGRLVLADGVAYAQKDLKANIILDMATLTGAQGISTGKYHAAILTNNGPWEDSCMQAGLKSGDLVFPILYAPELHFSEFSSAVADMKNSVADRSNAQSSCAGLFINVQLGFDFPGTWVHVDMATPVHCVTGSNKGIGYSIVKGLCAKFQGDVFLTARSEAKGKAAVEKLKKLGFNPLFFQLDIVDQASINSFKEHLQNTYGGIDILVNNAAICFPVGATEPFGEQAEKTLAVNYFGTLNVCEALYSLLRQDARVVNISSSAGHLSRIPSEDVKKKFSDPNLTIDGLNIVVKQFIKDAKENKHIEQGWGNSAYVISKNAVTALTKIQQRFFDQEKPYRNVSVNAVHPGYVNTDLNEHHGGLTTEEGARAPLYLALEANLKGQYVWFDNRVLDWTASSTPTRH